MGSKEEIARERIELVSLITHVWKLLIAIEWLAVDWHASRTISLRLILLL